MRPAAKPFTIEILQKALNCYLALDPLSKERLRTLQGKVVTVELLGMGLIFHLVFTDTAVYIQPDISSKADTTIKGTPLRLLHMTLTRENRQRFFADDVSIQGSAELGQQVIDLFDHMDIDWEEYLSHWVGDVPAHHIGNLGRKIKAFTKNTREIILQNVNEYVHEEANFFPPREALHDFFQDVDSIRMDADRLEARIQQLQKWIDIKRGSL